MATNQAMHVMEHFDANVVLTALSLWIFDGNARLANTVDYVASYSGVVHLAALTSWHEKAAIGRLILLC